MNTSYIYDEYFEWLYNLVDGKNGINRNYRNLMRLFYHVDFYWSVFNDDNRAEDGKALRAKFCAETCIVDEKFLYDPCSVLEMMIGLAHRIENDFTYDPEIKDRTAEWFHEMIRNLCLLDCTDDNWDDIKHQKSLHTLLNMMDRTYDFDGFGGLFPLKNAVEDQRNVEIWRQMTSYFREKGLFP